MKKLNIISMLMFGVVLTNTKIVHALDVEPYRIPGLESVFWDEDVPPALRLTSAGDGLATGTILYRNSHKDIDYYSPIPPASLQGTTLDPNGGKYDDWGPWDMPSNKISRGIIATYHYDAGVINTSAIIETDDGSGSNYDTVTVGTLPSGTKIEIYAIRGDYVYFDLTKHPTLEKKGVTNVARVLSSKVTYSSSKIALIYTHSDSVLLDNFKPVGKYSNNMRSFYKGVETGKYKNPSHAPSVVANRSGEWRYLGYNAEGETLDNPYFISDAPSFQTIALFSGYPWRYTPWNKNDAESGESDVSEAYNRFTIGAKSFEYDTNSKYTSLKQDVINRMIEEGHISSVSDYINRISLRTFPTKQPTILLGQRKDSALYRVGFMPLYGGLRDIYMKSMTIKNEEGTEIIAQTTCDISGYCNPATGTVEKGERYKIEVVLANGANSNLLKNTLESQVGFMYNASKTYKDLPYSRTSNGKIMRMGNKGYIYGSIHSQSRAMTETLYVSTDGTIDVYGYVGGSHTGVDNLNYGNDTAVIRLNIAGTPPPPQLEPCKVTEANTACSIINGGNTKICGGGDIRPYAVKIFSKTDGGELVYHYIVGESSPRIQKALIPGYEYRIVYNLIYEGSHIFEYTWIPPVQDDPETEDINEYTPGKWSQPKYATYKVPLNYYIEKYSGGTRDMDSISKSGNGFEAHPVVEDINDLDIDMFNGVRIGYYADIMMFQHPYLKTTFKVNTNNPRINGNVCNDEMTLIINDNFDIAINNLKVTPSTSYVGESDSKVNYNVTYDSSLTTPDYVSEDNHQASVNTAININGQTFYVKDQLLKGNNKDITHSIEGVKVPSSGQVTVNVNLNYDKGSYETGDYSNNKASTKVNIVKVKDPGKGSPNETVKSPDSLNSDKPNAGGDANNNCLIPRRSNTWTTSHRKFSWNSDTITYNKISNKASVSFKKYYTTYKNANEATESYKEEFGIKEIWFRSKDTKDKKYGNDGWVNLLDSKQKDLAIIKAGYGFELKIVTKYSTDAFSKRTWNVYNNGSSGTMVSALNTKANYGFEDIFLELPGTMTTRKILSSTGYESTILGLDAKREVSGQTVTWTYTVKAKDSLGLKETPKIFIPENTKDGDYTLKIYTPPVSGVGSINKKTYSALCDRVEVKIKVKGSATDDLNSHSTQIR